MVNVKTGYAMGKPRYLIKPVNLFSQPLWTRIKLKPSGSRHLP
jgi:hypothetical protein